MARITGFCGNYRVWKLPWKSTA